MSLSRLELKELTLLYYNQLIYGCKNNNTTTNSNTNTNVNNTNTEECYHENCASNKSYNKLNSQESLLLSINLAKTYGNKKLCNIINQNNNICSTITSTSSLSNDTNGSIATSTSTTTLTSTDMDIDLQPQQHSKSTSANQSELQANQESVSSSTENISENKSDSKSEITSPTTSTSAKNQVEEKEKIEKIEYKPIIVSFNEVFERYKRSVDESDIPTFNKFISELYSHPENLDESFLSLPGLAMEIDDDIERTVSIQSSMVTAEDPSIDFTKLNEMHELLSNNDLIAEIWMEAIQKCTSSTAFAPKNSAIPLISIRKYLMLLNINLFMDPSYYIQYRLLCKGISDLSSLSRNSLIHWIYKIHAVEDVENLISIAQQYITVMWHQNPKNNKLFGIPEAVSVLGVFHSAYKLIFDDKKKNSLIPIASSMPLGLFYNEAINTPGFNMKEDFRKYIKYNNDHFSFCKYSFMLDPATKARILQLDAEIQMNQAISYTVREALMNGQTTFSPYLNISVNRETIRADAFDQIQLVDAKDLKKPIKVKFIGEDGVDAGGVLREFFSIVLRDLFNVQYGMFREISESNSTWFNSGSTESRFEFELIGRLLGLAIFNSVILDIHFPMVVYRKLLKQDVGLGDLYSVFPELAKGFEQLLNFDGDVESVYQRNFTVEVEEYGVTSLFELKPDGANIPLNNINRVEYVQLYVDYLLNKSVDYQFKDFQTGFWDVAGGEALKLYAAEELELVICGSKEIDFVALEKSTTYEEPFDEDNCLIKDFWTVVHSLSIEDKKKFLFFCTGSDRVPLRGLSKLKFAISPSGGDANRLLSSHTCFNHLLLPPYENIDILRDKLMQSIENREGFGLH